MGFTTETFFFIFLPITILICIFVSSKRLNLCAIALNAVFYLWGGLGTATLFAAFIFGCYLFGHLIELAEGDRRKWMTCAVGIAVIILAYYKYLNFLLNNANALIFGGIRLDFAVSAIAPLGISFTTFSAISYFVDVYRGRVQARSLLDVALYFSFFPKLLSGPIALWKDFAPQIEDASKRRDIIGGINRIILGYAKKAVIADSLGLTVTEINNRIPAGVDAATYWLKALLYMFELYYDFSGYSDIAIGLGMLFGIKLPENFRQPYTSTSITEFWRRWHISLGTWFREYVYIPLGGNRKGNVYKNLLVVFLLTGIWHGANWTFLLWGLFHGVLIVLERFLCHFGKPEKIPAFFRWTVTTIILYFSWILFMSPSIRDAFLYFSRMFGGNVPYTLNFTWRYFVNAKVVVLLFAAFIGSGVSRFIDNHPVKLVSIPSNIRFALKEMAYLLLLALSMLCIVNSSYSPFLYFQF